MRALLGVSLVVVALRWSSGRVQWWTTDGRLAMGGLLPADRKLIQAAEALLLE